MNHTQRILNRRDTLRDLYTNLDSAWFALYDLQDRASIYQPITLNPLAIERARIERAIMHWLVCSIPFFAMVLGFVVPLVLSSVL